METPPISETIPLEAQVGGHPGVMTTEDGSLLIKPALPAEVSFYQSAATDPGFEPLRPFLPVFYGTLKLEGKVDPDTTTPADIAEGTATVSEVNNVPPEEKDEYSLDRCSIVLENLSHRFLKPNILDIKLGTILYDESASPEKRARMEQTARETTSLETGVRLTGFQVYDLTTDQPVVTPKSYGKSISASQLSEGIARFFPLADSPAPHPNTGTGVPIDVLLPMLEQLWEDVNDIRAALAQVHLRMVGASLLIVYEADWQRARDGFNAAMEDEEDEDDEDDEESGGDETEEKKKNAIGPPYIVKLIDFAHTRIAPGEGPDEGVLLGMNTVLRLLDGRIDEIRAELRTDR